MEYGSPALHLGFCAFFALLKVPLARWHDSENNGAVASLRVRNSHLAYKLMSQLIGEEGGREWWLTVQIHFQPVLTPQRLDKKGGADFNLQV